MSDPLTTRQMTEAIHHHTEHLIEAARGQLDAAVAACPVWSVADLVDHLTEVQWTWGTIVSERLTVRPTDSWDERVPPRGLDESAALAQLSAVCAELVSAVDGDVDHQATPVWTWASANQTIGFVTRHQVQEAAVHDHDACAATGVDWSIEPVVAADCVGEFWAYSTWALDDPAPEGTARLGSVVELRATDTGDVWTIADATEPGLVEVTRGPVTDDGLGRPEPLVVSASAGQLLLWLYGRIELVSVPIDIVARLRALIQTD